MSGEGEKGKTEEFVLFRANRHVYEWTYVRVPKGTPEEMEKAARAVAYDISDNEGDWEREDRPFLDAENGVENVQDDGLDVHDAWRRIPDGPFAGVVGRECSEEEEE